MDNEAAYVKSPAAVGTGSSEDEKKPLSEIINTLNDKFGTDFSEEDRLFFEQIKEKAVKDERVVKTAIANPVIEKFELGIKAIIESFMLQRLSENDSIVSRYMSDIDFQKPVFHLLAKDIYKTVRNAQRELNQ